MTSNYQEILISNQRNPVDIKDMGEFFAEKIYSDPTHFIFELLQNAEDALKLRLSKESDDNLPRKVTFQLYKDKLLFSHYGKKFDTQDIKGITRFLKGTKKNDRSQKGQFGIGFKSVYAITSTPIIHSGDEHFEIKNYIHPYRVNSNLELDKGKTLFIFPFNNTKYSKVETYNIIKDKLQKLDVTNLLFLENISEIEWQVGKEFNGFYLKNEKQINTFTKEITLFGKQYEEVDETWLVFSKSLNEKPNKNPENIEIAFKLNDTTAEKEIDNINIAPLFIFFQTSLKTNLGFIINGPFDPVANRSNIKNNQYNKKLIKKISTFLTNDVLMELKKMDLISVNLLKSLPINELDFPEGSLFRPIYIDTKDVLLNSKLLPAYDGTYISGKNSKLVRSADLTKLLPPETLQELLSTDKIYKWITIKITSNRNSVLYDYINRDLQVKEIDPKYFAKKINDSFLENRSNRWMIEFYKFLTDRKSLWDGSTTYRSLKTKPIIRLQDGTNVRPFDREGNPNAFLPPKYPTGFPTIAKDIIKEDEAYNFLQKLGLTKPNIIDEVRDKILPKYEDNTIGSVTFEQHLIDLDKILKSYNKPRSKKQEMLFENLKNTTFIFAKNLVLDKEEFKEPKKIYFHNKDLEIYFKNNDDIWFLSQNYDEKFNEMFKSLGISDKIRINCKPYDESKEYIQYVDYSGKYIRGYEGFDPDIKVDGLEYALENPEKGKSKFIWNNIATKYKRCIRGKIIRSSRYDFSPEASIYEMEKDKISNFGYLLMENKWLPTKGNEFVKPSDIILDELPETFIRDEELSQKLEMKTDAIGKLVKEAGISKTTLDIARTIEKDPDIYDQVQSILKSKRSESKPTFPVKESQDPERRKNKVYKPGDEIPDKEYPKKDRKTRISKSKIDQQTYLRNNYRNPDGIMVCQICKNKMPFKKRDGNYYFESVEIFTNDILPKEHESQFLALCPVCAAMYKEFIKSSEDEMITIKNKIEQIEENKDQLEIEIVLGELDTNIKFTEVHLIDLCTLLQIK